MHSGSIQTESFDASGGSYIMNIGLISDTHGVFREEWKRHFAKCDCLIHAGDLDSKRIYEKFQQLGIPVYMVRGNCDHGEYGEFLPESMNLPLGGKLFKVIHNRNYLPMNLEDIDYVIYGHTHIPDDETRRGIRYINPGSAGQDRGAGRTMMILHLAEEGESKLEWIRL